MKFLMCLFLAFPFIVGAQIPYENILIESYSGAGYQPCEPSIAVSLTDQRKVVAGSILDKVYTSADSGKTWTIDKLRSPLGVFGDPCIVASPLGSFYYLHLSDPDQAGWSSERLLDRIVCQYSKNSGASWSKGGGIGQNGSKDQDKEWACVSNDGKMVYTTWTQFDKYASTQEGDSTLILFSCAKKKAKKWSDPQRISAIAGDCIDDDMTVEGAVPTTGPNGELYVSWALANSIWFDKSLDGGKTWLSSDIEVSTIQGGWAHDIPGINRANGMPVTSCDRSGGPHNGRIYINWADQRNGKADTDIWLVYSDDQGLTWSEAIRVNDDPPGKQQFFTWMDVDQSNGAVYIVFYDRRAHDDNSTDVYLASSTEVDRGFLNECISSSPFTPNQSLFFGDYNNISAVNGVVRPIWTRCEGMKLSVWTALVNK